MPKKALREAATATPTKSGGLMIGLISPGWGSSGYYSAKVLENAAGPTVFPAGTQMYLDHPTESEQYDRPERSVRDIAAVLAEDAYWDAGLQKLVAEAKPVAAYADLLTDPTFSAAVGVSIRSYADTTIGEAEGRKGTIITSLTEGISADFVTHAGRGGSILQVFESVRPVLVNERAVSRGVAEATANDTREALASELTEAYGAENTYVGVRDFDDATVWFWISSPDSEATYQQGYTQADDGAVTLAAGDPTEVMVRTEYVPVPDSTESAPNVPAPAGQSNPTQSPQEDTMPQIEESRLAQLEADAGRATLAESERDTATGERDTARRELAAYRAREGARPVVAQRVAESGLPARRQARVVEAVLAGVMIADDGTVNSDAVVAATEAAITEAQADLAEIAEALGVGRVTGFGVTTADTVTEADVAKSIAAAFGRKPKEA